MSSVRQILKRKDAVTNIRKVTRTMEMISTSRYRDYYLRWEGSMGFYDSLAQLAYLIVTSQKPINSPLMHENKGSSSAVLALGSDRGLCGSYNANIQRLLDVHINRAKRLKRQLKIYAAGKKIINFLRHRGVKITEAFEGLGEIPSIEKINEISDRFIADYRKGEINYFGIVYTRFYSIAAQHAQTLTVLPLADLIDDLTTRATVIWPWKLNFEDFLLSPPADELFSELADMMVRSAVSSCFLDAALSEHLARVAAMRNATENAEQMIEELTTEYNRARQTQITSELLDIITGANVLC